MIIKLYSIWDVYNGFAPPVVMPNHETAIRWFEDMKRENATIGNNPEDFSVHYIGTLNTDTGEIKKPEDNIFLKHDLKNIGDKEARK